ncbi:Chloroplast stem-loop binding of 41 kDa chloroplastic [Micractinium conductrix]|uniref:Chloroplast stem-loop binding of 41 kDa chloroplastic n=1 Tax=Micractinium conductrix TaxID=554055 RepID=A0A2P6VPW4_9CHLO|nr:Chloroplast stem-loop binding of 41 kDa chloroplastic [Micractinium conductrix]|eukprot:PSC76107.1 Chloroplast stem-loop binding of 41 kDa chloroplastic [Micractinium conductrix]
MAATLSASARCAPRAAAPAPRALVRTAGFAGMRRMNVLDVAEACPMAQARQAVCRRSGAAARSAAARAVTVMAAAVAPKKILMLGGTRFIGVYLARQLIEAGHEVTLLTRGKKPVTYRIPDDTDESFERFASSVKHIACDRTDAEAMKAALSNKGFEVVYDINGREADEAATVLDAVGPIEQYIFCSSAGVYKKSDQMPHREEDEGDFKSRHKGKLFTEDLLEKRGVNWTSVRPVYIYGPLNYNPVEEFFFHRIKAGRPICVPGSGMQVTQLGHVKDLATAFVKILGNPKAARQVYNVAGERYVTFDGIAKACAAAMGAPEPELVHFNPKDFDFGKSKAFPMRDQHFFASVDKAMADLDWAPEFGLLDGLRDSYEKDFGRGTYRKEPDYTADDMVLAKLKGKVSAMA